MDGYSMYDSFSPAAISMPGDWRDVLQEMLALPGYNKQRIAQEIGVSVATLRRLQQNTRLPSNKTVQKLLSLYCLIQTQTTH